MHMRPNNLHLQFFTRIRWHRGDMCMFFLSRAHDILSDDKSCARDAMSWARVNYLVSTT